MFKRQTTGSVVCASCGSLVGVRDEKCYNCGRRNPGLWGFAPLLRSLGNDLGFVPLVVWGCGALYVISLLLSGNAHAAWAAASSAFSRPDSGVLYLLGASGGDPGLRVRPVVDGAERRLASRQPAPHHLQHDVGARSRSGRRRHVRRRPHGDHLHRRGCVRFSAELVRLRVSAAPAVSERRRLHRRRVGVGLRISRRAGVLRPAHRQLADALRGASGTR